MKSYIELKSAVSSATSPQQAAGTFVDGIATLIENNRSDPSTLSDVAKDLRTNRSNLIHSISGGTK